MPRSDARRVDRALRIEASGHWPADGRRVIRRVAAPVEGHARGRHVAAVTGELGIWRRTTVDAGRAVHPSTRSASPATTGTTAVSTNAGRKQAPSGPTAR